MSPSDPRIAAIRATLDTLFKARVARAEHIQERDAAVLRLLPPDLQDVVGSVLREFEDLFEFRSQTVAQLEAQVKRDVRALGAAVKGTHLQATYGKGRTHYNEDGLRLLAERSPEIASCLSQGDPIVSIKGIAQRAGSSPLLYDTHG